MAKLLQAFINNKKDKLSRKSLELLRTIIRNALEHAMLDDKLLKNPATGIKLPKQNIDDMEDVEP